MNSFCSHNLLIVPDTGDQLIQYKLAPFWECILAHILHIFQDGLAAVAVLQSSEKAVHQIYDEVPPEALAPVFFSKNELQYSSEFQGILLDFPFLEPRSMHLIMFFIRRRLGDFNDFPSPQRDTQGHIHIECCGRKLFPIWKSEAHSVRIKALY